MTHEPPPTKARRTTALTTVALVLLSTFALAAATPTASACSGDAESSPTSGACLSIAAIIAEVLAKVPKKACTTTEGSCKLDCEAGDRLYVAASGGIFLHASVLCGGRGAECSSTLGGVCQSESSKTVPANDQGICQGSQFNGRPTISCASAKPEKTG